VSRKTPFSIVPGRDGGAPGKSVRVLIADDDRDNATMLSVLLEHEGHDVVVALRGDEALELSRLFRPDVLIADVNMPGISGYAIAREIRHRHGNLAPLLIAISGVWTKPSDKLLGQTVGFDHYLVKPVDPKELLRLINPLRGSAAAESS
jgi:DNA-binding response OmpR family regulator